MVGKKSTFCSLLGTCNFASVSIFSPITQNPPPVFLGAGVIGFGTETEIPGEGNA